MLHSGKPAGWQSVRSTLTSPVFSSFHICQRLESFRQICNIHLLVWQRKSFYLYRYHAYLYNSSSQNTRQNFFFLNGLLGIDRCVSTTTFIWDVELKMWRTFSGFSGPPWRSTMQDDSLSDLGCFRWPALICTSFFSSSSVGAPHLHLPRHQLLTKCPNLQPLEIPSWQLFPEKSL